MSLNSQLNFAPNTRGQCNEHIEAELFSLTGQKITHPALRYPNAFSNLSLRPTFRLDNKSNVVYQLRSHIHNLGVR